MNINYNKKYLKYKTKYLNYLHGGTTDNQCSLCLASLDSLDSLDSLPYYNPVYVLKPCCHKFHANCIIQWLCKEANTCPNCRQTVSENTCDKLEDLMVQNYIKVLKDIEIYKNDISLSDDDITALRIMIKINIISNFFINEDLIPRRLTHKYNQIKKKRIHNGREVVNKENTKELVELEKISNEELKKLLKPDIYKQLRTSEFIPDSSVLATSMKDLEHLALSKGTSTQRTPTGLQASTSRGPRGHTSTRQGASTSTGPRWRTSTDIRQGASLLQATPSTDTSTQRTPAGLHWRTSTDIREGRTIRADTVPY